MASDINKENIRTIINQKLNKLSKEEIKQKSQVIAGKLLAHPCFKEANYLLIYVSFKGEVMTHELILEMLRLGKKVIVPKCDLANEVIRLFEIGSMDRDLKVGTYGILEPDSSLEEFKGRLDLVIAPGIAFDKSAGRLGRGKGYFDKLLKKAECLGAYKIALGFQLQVMDSLVMDKHDVWMNEVITENNNYKR